MDEWKIAAVPAPPELELSISPRRAVLIVIFSILAMAAVAVLFRIIVIMIWGKITWNSPFMLVELLIVLPAVLIIQNYHYPLKKAFRFNPVSVSILIWSIVIGFSMAIVGDQLDRIVQTWLPMPPVIAREMEALFRDAPLVDFLLLLFIGTLGAGFCEEMLFRGFLQQILEKKWRFWLAIATPAIMFGLIHFMPWLILQITLLGVVLGLLVWRCNSIFPAILVHAINNCVAILYIRLNNPQLDSVYLRGELVNPILVLAAIAGMFIASRQIWQLTVDQTQ